MNNTLRSALKTSFYQSLKPLVKTTCIAYAAENFTADKCIQDLIQSLGQAMEEAADEMEKGNYHVPETV